MKSRFYAGTEDGKSISIRRIDESFRGATVYVSFRGMLILIVLLLHIITVITVFRYIRDARQDAESIRNKKNYTVNSIQTAPGEKEEKNGIKPAQTVYLEKGIIFYESSASLLSEKDIDGLKASNDFQKELRAAINEIYARNGLDFQTESIKEYYLKFDWYNPAKKIVHWEDFNEIEKANLTLLISVEKEYGFR